MNELTTIDDIKVVQDDEPKISRSFLHDKDDKYVPLFSENDKEICFYSCFEEFYGVMFSVQLSSIDIENPTQLNYTILENPKNLDANIFNSLKFKDHLNEVVNDILTKIWLWEQDKDKH